MFITKLLTRGAAATLAVGLFILTAANPAAGQSNGSGTPNGPQASAETESSATEDSAKPKVSVERKDSAEPKASAEPKVAVKQGSSQSGDLKRWGLSLHAGVGIPHGDFGEIFDPGFSGAVDLEYRINTTVSLEAIYGYERFRSSFFSDSLNTHHLSANVKFYGSSAPTRPFFNFGGGVYNFGGATTRGGVNVGGGIQHDVSSSTAIEASYNFHNVFTSGSHIRFSTVHGGVRFRF